MKKVRTKGKVVSEIMVPIYATVDEIVGSEPAERIIAVFNNGNHVRLMGNERMKFSSTKTGKKKRNQLAFNCLTTDELMSVAQDADKLAQLLESPEVQARVDAALVEENDYDSDIENQGETDSEA